LFRDKIIGTNPKVSHKELGKIK